MRALFGGGTEDARSRGDILVWNCAANVAANLIGGNFLVGLYSVLGLSDALLGLIPTLTQLCALTQIFSPIILNRFQYRKRILLISRVTYYACAIVLIGLTPFIPVGQSGRAALLVAFTMLGNLANALVAPGYSVLHIRSIPEKTRADYFSVLNLLVNVCLYTAVMVFGRAVDFLKGISGSLLLGVTVARVFAIGFAALELRSHTRIREHEEPRTAAGGLRNMFMPLKNKPYLLCTVLACMWSLFANIPGVYYSSYIIKDIKAPYTYLGAVSMLSVPIMLVVTPIWNRIVKKTSWFSAMSAALAIYCSHYFMLSMVNPNNIYVLYTIALIVAYSASPGISIVTSNLPYQRLPDEGRSGYLAFYAASNSLSAMLGILLGSALIITAGPRVINLFGQAMGGKQYIMWLPCALLFALSCVYRVIAAKERRGAAIQA
ncbi:MAG: MFS transporter [Oscillospiraceae bacterium]|jgi:hypothetical protein|nr:MFS transporter [Oscillospiraceae bacterium]